jgi:hypothetical protein
MLFHVGHRREASCAGDRHGAYKNVAKLPNPPNDAQDVAAALKRTGFDTILAFDVDKASMDEAEIRFARSARDADIALFYYSGHAIQYNGINYLTAWKAAGARRCAARRGRSCPTTERSGASLGSDARNGKSGRP